MSRTIQATTIAVALSLAIACRKDRTEEAAGGAVIDTPAVTATVVPPGGPPITIAVSEKNGAVVLTDASGHALYVADKTPACPGGDCGGFTPLTGKGTSGAPAVKEEMIGVTTLPDGSLAITYAGKPLYTYAKDTSAGDRKGQGKNVNGTTFKLATPQDTTSEKRNP